MTKKRKRKIYLKKEEERRWQIDWTNNNKGRDFFEICQEIGRDRICLGKKGTQLALDMVSLNPIFKDLILKIRMVNVNVEKLKISNI